MPVNAKTPRRPCPSPGTSGPSRAGSGASAGRVTTITSIGPPSTGRTSAIASMQDRPALLHAERDLIRRAGRKRDDRTFSARSRGEKTRTRLLTDVRIRRTGAADRAQHLHVRGRRSAQHQRRAPRAALGHVVDEQPRRRARVERAANEHAGDLRADILGVVAVEQHDGVERRNGIDVQVDVGARGDVDVGAASVERDAGLRFEFVARRERGRDRDAVNVERRPRLTDERPLDRIADARGDERRADRSREDDVDVARQGLRRPAARRAP